MPQRPTVLLEEWLPFDAVGAESLRDASAAQHPPLNRLHVWWARRPLTISRAAILASVLPAWDEGLRSLSSEFHSEKAYQAWFLRLLGIHGDPVAGRKLIRWAKERNITLKESPYGDAPRAFTVNPAPSDLALLRDLLRHTWGIEALTVLDPFSGGGSIPFEARRYGFGVVANELNPVAAVILRATLDYPARYGPDLAADIKQWGGEWSKRAAARLVPFFPKASGENIFAYLWARTVACPSTGKPVPLSPNWWLSKDPPVAVRLLTDPAWDAPCFEIVSGKTLGFDPDEGTVSRGGGRSPWTGEPIDGDYIKAQAQAGRLGQTLYAVAVKRRGGSDFRPPTPADIQACQAAKAELARRRTRWEALDIIPTEPIPEGLKTGEPLRYGMTTWADMFSPRQLLALGTFVETLRDLRREMQAALGNERAAAVETYLAFALDKAPNYNSRMSVWHPLRTTMANTFNRHDFAFAWSHGEFDAASNLLPWCIDQIHDAYRDLAKLITQPQATLGKTAPQRGPLTLLQGNAGDLPTLADGSVHAIVTDPPYYDNVMYAELADFFYVWLKRTAGHLYPGWFAAALTNKDDEAVANPARFRDLSPSPSPARGGGQGARSLADQDYERKMGAAFREMHRVLADDGVLTVMFTHKRVEAWDTLASALINAGFRVESSWPVHTESEHSLHQAQKNAASSTILLACRKRIDKETGKQGDKSAAISHQLSAIGNAVWWDDIAPRVRQVAREKAAEFASLGISGVDLYISVFGPALAVISEQWPVYTGGADPVTGRPLPLRPDAALDLARQEVVALRKRGLLGGHEAQFDPVTDWYLMAWDAFAAATFPADEGRKLAIALGLDVERDLVARRVVGKRGSDLTLLTPLQRRGRGKADPEAGLFDALLDAVHTAMLVYAEDGAAACENFLKRAGLRTDARFRNALQAMLNAVPRARKGDEFVVPEAGLLEKLRLAFFEDLVAPAEEEPEVPPSRQMELWE